MRRAIALLFLIMIGAVLVAGCSSSNSSQPMTSTGTQGGAIQVKIDYSGKWSGSMGAGGNIKTVDGVGPQTFDLQNPGSFVSVSAQKQDDSKNKMTVSILRNGNVIATEFTDAAYGVAMTSASV